MAATFLSESIRWRFLNHDSVAATAYPVLLLAALFLPDWRWRLAALATVTAGAFHAWLRGYRRYRRIVDTPTSRVVSAAQGYVELEGRAEPLGSGDPIGFAVTPPAVWLRYTIYRRSEDGLTLIERGQSASVFAIEDGSGRCLVDPEGAEVYTSRRFREESGDFVYRGEYIAPGDTLYLLGWMRTRGGRLGHETETDVGALISHWKSDRDFLLREFDRNGDGEIDMAEWQDVRDAAQANVHARQREAGYDPVTHRVETGGRGLPYLISNRPEAWIARRYRNWSLLHLLVLLVAGALTASLALHRPSPPVATAVRAVFVTVPQGMTLTIDDRAFIASGPSPPGGPAGPTLHRTTLPVGPAEVVIGMPDGKEIERHIRIPEGDRLLLISVTGDPNRPLWMQ